MERQVECLSHGHCIFFAFWRERSRSINPEFICTNHHRHPRHEHSSYPYFTTTRPTNTIPRIICRPAHRSRFASVPPTRRRDCPKRRSPPEETSRSLL